MARKTFTVDDVVDMLDRWHRGESVTKVSASLGVDRKTVQKYLRCALAADIRPGSRTMSPADWTALIHSSHPQITEPRLRRRTWLELDPFRDQVDAQRRQGLTLEAIWRRLRRERGVAVSLASFKRWASDDRPESR
jgi:hypothetical protein